MPFPDFPDTFQDLEQETLARWRAEELFQRTLEATAGGPPFVFYEGPPTANGRPGLHHVISRTIKDLVCRHRTMMGHEVTRIAGWDTHGLAVEIEAERKLGFNGKPDIEALGIEGFNRVCRESVFTYKEEWEGLSERIGYWLDYSRAYVTFRPEYIESVWWILARLAERGLLYRGYKSVPYCPRCGTALSSHEVAQGYEEIEDPSLFFLCPVVGEDGAPDGRAFLVWTTTPWTVPSNTGLAVHPDLDYVEVEREGRCLIVARDRLDAVFGEPLEVLARHRGTDLVGLRYRRPLDLVPEPAELQNAWTVVAEEFVSADDGTGVVHMAPAFGSDDYAAGQRHGLPLLKPIDDAGVFAAELPRIGGLFVKDADAVVIEEMAAAGTLFRAETQVHSYPHCWRCHSPLLYLARDSWFAATSTLKEDLLRNNDQVDWVPREVGEKRFGEWLKGNVDWALSRDRFWGTPLPVWVCDAHPEHVHWVGSLDELSELAGGLPADFDPHRPFIDELTWSCECGATMRRSPAVLDVWFDSGAMPFAQWHYPFENEAEFDRHFPADFICEGLDQTRGWFYSLMAISTMLGRGPAYKAVVVNDLILDAEGQKMSKSAGNAADPWEAVAAHGADALRWTLITSSNPWVPKRYDPEAVRESSRRFFDTLANTYRFLALYAGTEGWEPSEADPASSERGVLDRWMLSRLAGVTQEVGRDLSAYQVTRAYRRVAELVDDLSNWYVRRSRTRFWGHTDRADSCAAFRTLWDTLQEVARLLAPLTPFVADWLHRALTGRSVHLEAFPEASVHDRDEPLEAGMAATRALVSLGRAAREEVRIRVRQPLRELRAALPGERTLAPDLLALIRDELNVKDVRLQSDARGWVTLVARPDFRALGPRFGKSTNAAAEAVRALSEESLRAYARGETVRVSVDGVEHALGEDDLEVVEQALGAWVVKGDGLHTVALDPTLDEELRIEGLARELVNRVQRLRRDAGLDVTDRIVLGVYGPGDIRQATESWKTFVTGETLAVQLDWAPAGDAEGWDAFKDVDLDGIPVSVALRRHPG